jgi:hypothetical protein
MSETTPGASYDKLKSRRGYLPVEAVDVHDGGIWNVLISPAMKGLVAKSGMGRPKELTDSVRCGQVLMVVVTEERVLANWFWVEADAHFVGSTYPFRYAFVRVSRVASENSDTT